MGEGPIRIAHVVGKMRAGGIESFLMNYYRHIDRSQVQFDFIIDEDSPNRELLPEIHDLGGRVFSVPPYQQLNNYHSAMVKVLKGNEWSIVHSHINSLSVFPLWAAKEAGVPVRIAHSHTTMGKGEAVRNAAKLILRNFANVYPTHRAACSIHAGEWLFGKRSEFFVIPNAIEIERFMFNKEDRDAVRENLGIRPDQLVVGHVGRFMAQKNHAYLLDIFEAIARYDDKAILLLLGEGPLRQSIENNAMKMELSDRVVFAGQQDQPERYYSAFDVFALPSSYEGFGIVALEAQVSGLPCIASVHTPREVALSEGVCFLPIGKGDEKVWANRIWETAGTLARNSVDSQQFKNYDIRVAAKELVDTYTLLYEKAF